jgi:hypothetical protein
MLLNLMENGDEPPSIQDKQGSLCDITLGKSASGYRIWHRVKRHSRPSDGHVRICDSLWSYVGTARNTHLFCMALPDGTPNE